MNILRINTFFLRIKRRYSGVLIIPFSLVVFLSSAELILSFFPRFNPSLDADPYSGIYNTYPFFVSDKNRVSLNTARYPQLFPGEFMLHKEKKRYFIFGGSNVYQLSEQKHLSVSYIDELKKMVATKTGKEPEIVNCGGISWGSMHAAAIAHEAAEYSPDAFIIYSGHNDFSWKAFAQSANILKTPVIIVHIRAFVSQFRIYIFLKQIFRTIITHTTGFYHNQTATETIPVQYVETFKENLSYIAELCQKKKIPLILCSVPSNMVFPPSGTLLGNTDEWKMHYKTLCDSMTLFCPYFTDDPMNIQFKYSVMNSITQSRDFSGFLNILLSSHQFSPNETEQMTRYYKTTFTLHNKSLFSRLFSPLFSGNNSESEFKSTALRGVESAKQAEKIYDFSAMLSYRHAICLFAAGNYLKAKEYFIKSSLLDTFPAKSTPKISKAIQDTALQYKTSYIDFETILAQNSFCGIYGWQFFDDNCHLNDSAKMMLIKKISDTISQR